MSGRYWLANTRAQLASAAGFGLIVLDDIDDRAGQVAKGRIWQRLQLAMTREGIAALPLNQVLEMVERDRRLDQNGAWAETLDGLAKKAGHVTFAFRFGRPLRNVPQSARRAINDLMAKRLNLGITTARTTLRQALGRMFFVDCGVVGD